MWEGISESRGGLRAKRRAAPRRNICPCGRGRRRGRHAGQTVESAGARSEYFMGVFDDLPSGCVWPCLALSALSDMRRLGGNGLRKFAAGKISRSGAGIQTRGCLRGMRVLLMGLRFSLVFGDALSGQASVCGDNSHY